MNGKSARLLVLTAYLLTLGLHTAVLQAVAWAKMTVEFARQDGLAVSVEKTFDGRHPCAICVSLKKVDTRSSLIPAATQSPTSVAANAAPRVAARLVAWAVDVPVLPSLERPRTPAGPPPKAVLS
jgi:hypothetical protein